MPSSAIVIIGHDDTFANSEELAALLDAHVVLFLLSPSSAILEALHKAKRSAIDMPSVILEEDVCLIVHKLKILDS